MGKPFTFDRVVRMLIALALVAGAIWLIDLLSQVLLPFLVAWLLAYLMEPFVQYNRRLLRVRTRMLPVFMTLFEFGLIFTLLCVAFVPSIMKEVHEMGGLIKEYAIVGNDVPFLPQSVHDFLRNAIDLDGLSQLLRQQSIESYLHAISRILSGSLSMILGLFSWLMVILYVIFIMLDYEKLLRGFKRLVPTRYQKTVFGIGNDIKNSMNHYFRGQALIAFCVGILFSIGFYIINLPLAIVLGMFIGLLNMVPYLQLISIIPTTFLCLVYSVDANIDFWSIWWASMAVYLIVQAIQDLILTPKIMGHQMGLNPAIILLSLSVWGSLLGFIGLIIALPLTTLVISYYNRYILRINDRHALEHKKAAP